ncbi:MAG TPA: 1-acyl-sn-glycerol-3-phosphate acyltransferase [Candidatus Jeotgalibaca merdavium]|uniref:1-acyl-sn-glycerol-3-phosphate acyltransferase n=1 Tax=Candidatus Jeotgalibaca merdavium TaxID=2838627 RepID=A0A9D2I0Y6_9LACT|nr:1-acyl-sn-glycerol-3-phosphate acyltransferase [Candidatus Jeotgalibaca merdavium]
MFYNCVVRIVGFIVWLLNGKTDVQNKEKLPKAETYILAAPHRSWLDPIFIAVAAYPHVYSTMAKQELFKKGFINWFLRKMHAFPVNRENPGPSALKQPVNILKEGERNIFIFSTGSRYDNEVKGGTSAMARLAKVPIVPVVFQGPFSLKALIKRENAFVRFGDPIRLPEGKRISKDELAAIDQALMDSFDRLDNEVNPNFKYDYTKKQSS